MLKSCHSRFVFDVDCCGGFGIVVVPHRRNCNSANLVATIFWNFPRNDDEIFFLVLVDFKRFGNSRNLVALLHVCIPEHDWFDFVSSNNILCFVFDRD